MFLKTFLVILAFGAESRVLGLECYHTNGVKTQEELVFEQKKCKVVLLNYTHVFGGRLEQNCFGTWNTISLNTELGTAFCCTLF